jgi:hypothetical protein
MRVVSYNIQYSLGRDGVYDLARTVDAVRDADVICLQEVDRHWPRTAMADQAADIAALLPDRYWVFGPMLDIDASTVDADGRVRYVASFVLHKPRDMAQASGLLWHDVPNRGGNFLIPVVERNLGDIGLASGWQADNAGNTAVPAGVSVAGTPLPSTVTNHYVSVPVAKNVLKSTPPPPLLVIAAWMALSELVPHQLPDIGMVAAT